MVHPILPLEIAGKHNKKRLEAQEKCCRYGLNVFICYLQKYLHNSIVFTASRIANPLRSQPVDFINYHQNDIDL